IARSVLLIIGYYIQCGRRYTGIDHKATALSEYTVFPCRATVTQSIQICCTVLRRCCTACSAREPDECIISSGRCTIELYPVGHRSNGPRPCLFYILQQLVAHL